MSLAIFLVTVSTDAKEFKISWKRLEGSAGGLDVPDSHPLIFADKIIIWIRSIFSIFLVPSVGEKWCATKRQGMYFRFMETRSFYQYLEVNYTCFVDIVTSCWCPIYVAPVLVKWSCVSKFIDCSFLWWILFFWVIYLFIYFYFLHVPYCHCLVLQCSYSEVLIHTLLGFRFCLTIFIVSSARTTRYHEHTFAKAPVC